MYSSVLKCYSSNFADRSGNAGFCKLITNYTSMVVFPENSLNDDLTNEFRQSLGTSLNRGSTVLCLKGHNKGPTI